MLKKLLVAMGVILISALASAFTDQEPGTIQETAAGATETHTLSTDDSGIENVTSPIPPEASKNTGNITLYGGERILKIPHGDLSALEKEAQYRLGELGEFRVYPFNGSANGSAVVYLGVSYSMLVVDKNENAALTLLVSSDKEKEKGTRKYPQNKLLDSSEKLLFREFASGLFNDKDQGIYIPRDYILFDNEPVPKVIVQQRKDVAVQYLRADGLDYLAFGFGPNAGYSMQEVIKNNGVFQSSGSGEGPIAPVPELDTVFLTSAGLLGVLLVSKRGGINL